MTESEFAGGVDWSQQRRMLELKLTIPDELSTELQAELARLRARLG